MTGGTAFDIPAGFPQAIREVLAAPTPSWDPNDPFCMSRVSAHLTLLAAAHEEVKALDEFVQVRRRQLMQALGGSAESLEASGEPSRQRSESGAGEVFGNEEVYDFEGNLDT